MKSTALPFLRAICVSAAGFKPDAIFRLKAPVKFRLFSLLPIFRDLSPVRSGVAGHQKFIGNPSLL